MAKIIRERRETEPEDDFREVIVERDREVERGSNSGLVAALVVVGIVLLLLLFGRGLFSGGGGGPTVPSTPSTQGR